MGREGCFIICKVPLAIIKSLSLPHRHMIVIWVFGNLFTLTANWLPSALSSHDCHLQSVGLPRKSVGKLAKKVASCCYLKDFPSPQKMRVGQTSFIGMQKGSRDLDCDSHLASPAQCRICLLEGRGACAMSWINKTDLPDWIHALFLQPRGLQTWQR